MKIEREFMKLVFLKLIVLLIFTGVAVQTVSGQGFDAVSMGMGGAYGAVARG
jgi:hypothetical protein